MAVPELASPIVTQNATTGPVSAQDGPWPPSHGKPAGRGLFSAFDGTQFGTRNGDNEGGGKTLFRRPPQAVSTAGPECDDITVDTKLFVTIRPRVKDKISRGLFICCHS